MDDKQLEYYRDALIRLREELQQAANEDASHEPVELDQTRQGRLSRMDALQAQQMARAVARRREEKLRRIEGALRRIESGDFGDCFVCGEPIEEPRLQADPSITRCRHCAAD